MYSLFATSLLYISSNPETILIHFRKDVFNFVLIIPFENDYNQI